MFEMQLNFMIRDTNATLSDQIWTNLFSSNIKAEVRLCPISDDLPVFMCFYTKDTNLKQEIKTRIKTNPKQKLIIITILLLRVDRRTTLVKYR